MPPKFAPTRERKHRRLAKQASSAGEDGAHAKTTAGQDSNALTVVPASKEEREERRRKMREELRAQQVAPKISAKKQKRLDKYIENKLKKDDNLILLKKLAKAKVDTSGFQSTKNLGKQKVVDREVPTTAEQSQNQSSKRGRKRGSRVLEPVDDLSDDSDLEEKAAKDDTVKGSAATSGGLFGASGPIFVGSGLKRPLEVGEDGMPIIKRRKRAKKEKKQPSFVVMKKAEPEWEGFSSGEDEEEDNGLSDGDGGGESQDEEVSSGDEVSGSEGDDTDEHYSEAENSNDAEEEDSDDESEDEEDDAPPRRSGFKAWAQEQQNALHDFHATSNIDDMASTLQSEAGLVDKIKHRPVPLEEDKLPEELKITTGEAAKRKAYSVHVERSEDLQKARMGLPIVGEEQKIMEAIHANSSVVIWGATGSGKTTQLPQFLFEAGYGNLDGPTPGMIGVTQPRRVAAVSMAKRVGDELGEHGDKVSYQIRFESTATSKTAIKFMTDGILLREIAQDFSLSKYSIILIDEAHERSVNTDILIGMVSRIVDLRQTMMKDDPKVKPLKLVIMSATLRISDFTDNANLFKQGTPPLVQAEGRQYPVTMHFARRTQADYVEEAFKKVSKGHRKLPPGAILVFLTGQNEIKDLMKRLKQAFPSTQTSSSNQGKVKLVASEAPLEAEDMDFGAQEQGDFDEDIDSDPENDGTDNKEDEGFDLEEEAMAASTKVHVLPLYSQLPTKEQLKVFDPPPEGSRLIVLATNVAETSLTIPGVRYVFDCGRSKEKQYDQSTGVQNFQIGWISKASANQRAGRAGRTGSGHCYRLYSSAVYERDFVEYTDPEILRTPIEGVVLQMKSMGLHHIVNFPFPTPPDKTSLLKAERLLKNLGALTDNGTVTDLGRSLAIYPLTPRYGKMLYIGHQHGCIPFVIAMVAALGVADLFIPENQLELKALVQDEDSVYTNESRLEDTVREKRRKAYGRAHALFSKHDRHSDALKLLSAVCAYAYSASSSASAAEDFCENMFLRQKALSEATELRRQLSSIVHANNPALLPKGYTPCLPEPNSTQLKALKQILTAGFIDQVAIRADTAPNPPSELAELPKPKRAIDVAYITLFSSHEGHTHGLTLEEKTVYIHPSSILAHTTTAKEMPQYLIYSHLQKSQPTTEGKIPRTRMFPLTPVAPSTLAALATGTPLLTYGKPIGKVVSQSIDKRECWVVPELVGDRKGGMGSGWPLPARKVLQKKKGGIWEVEKVLS